MHFRIIKLTNHDNPKEFTLEITRMRDIRQRIGILITGYNNHLNLDRPPKPSFNILSKLNYSYYAVYRGEFDTFEEVSKKETNFPGEASELRISSATSPKNTAKKREKKESKKKQIIP